jgi:hypothetical protein
MKISVPDFELPPKSQDYTESNRQMGIIQNKEDQEGYTGPKRQVGLYRSKRTYDIMGFCSFTGEDRSVLTSQGKGYISNV